ncbi:hypothetical protein A3K87_04245 [Variovorax paradoxus]|uniref:Uncharacterized protein n=1 Tax=Variovorax paradoxus TaxID=34073 RepID=A0AA91I7I1_VARPD|nr:hypothetical protein [Variovorax paradoxus]OAK55016.1 hypothetical protein A3K87_04245 [Variovorax paradoxus]
MITHTKQDWAAGNAVRIGFLTLTVVAAIATPGDFKPDAYVLASKTAFFHFVPHHGLTKIEAYEARELIAEGKRIAAQQAAAAIAKASATATHAAVIAQMLEVGA